MTDMTTTTAAPAVGTRRAAADGARAMLPLLLAVSPLGLLVGVAAAEADLPVLSGVATSSVIYGASAQLAAIDLLDRGAGPLLVVLTVVVINLRLAFYSAAMAPHWQDLDGRGRALAAYLLVDPSYVVGLEGYARPLPLRERHAFYLGGGVALWIGWHALTVVGAAVGAQVPAALDLPFAVPLCLLAMLVKQLDGRTGAIAATVGALVAVAGDGLPMATGLPLAIVAGVAVAACITPGTEAPEEDR